jgi:hypothetical protein
MDVTLHTGFLEFFACTGIEMYIYADKYEYDIYRHYSQNVSMSEKIVLYMGINGQMERHSRERLIEKKAATFF